MSLPTRLVHYLDERGARYDVFAHGRSRSSFETAHSAHVPPHQLAKSVLLEDDGGYVVAVLPADRALRLGELSRMLGREDLHLADEDCVAKTFADCDRGAVPAFGMAWGIETVVDDELETNDVVYVEAGDHERLLRLSRAQFHELMSASRHGPISGERTH